MNCPSKNKQDEEILLEYCDGSMTAEKTAEFEAHASGCPECGEWVSARQTLWQALDEWRAPEISPDFNSRLYARIAAEQNLGFFAKLRQSVNSWKAVLVTASAGAVLVIALVIGIGQLGQTPQQPPASKAGVENIDIEQIEHALEDLELLAPVPVAGGGAPGTQAGTDSRI